MTAVTEIRLPQFGMGMREGTILAWFKREGDHVAAGEVVAEIEAEKVTEELVRPAAACSSASWWPRATPPRSTSCSP